MGKRSPQLDLKTYDRATIDRVLAPARPAPDATVWQHAARSGRIAGSVWAAGLLALASLAYHFTLITTLRMPSAVPACLVLAVALTAAHRRRRGPNIHDRYTDYIVGIPLLGAAMLLLALGPSQLSVFAWLWRLDLLSLPLFVAGAISILFGVRALWAQRLPLTVVAFPWLLSITGMAGNQTVLTATVVLAALAVAFAGIASVRFLRSERPPGPSKRSARSPVALVILLAIALAAAVADQRLAEFQPLFDSAGRPTISAEAAMPAVPVSRNAPYGGARESGSALVCARAGNRRHKDNCRDQTPLAVCRGAGGGSGYRAHGQILRPPCPSYFSSHR